MSEKICGVYQILNTSNGDCYIGSSVDIRTRWNMHLYGFRHNKNTSVKLRRAWYKYGENSFKFSILEIVTEDKEELYKREQYYIDVFDSVDNGYNICPAAKSALGCSRSEETKLKISKSNTGKKCTEENKELFRKMNTGEGNPMFGRRFFGEENPFYGKHHTDETKEQLRKMRSGENSYWFGKTRSEETRAKMSESAKGKVWSEETKAKRLMSFNLTWDAKKEAGNRHPNYGKPIDEEVRIKMSEAKSGEKHPMYGKTHSEETKAKMSAAAKKRWADKKALKTTT